MPRCIRWCNALGGGNPQYVMATTRFRKIFARFRKSFAGVSQEFRKVSHECGGEIHPQGRGKLVDLEAPLKPGGAGGEINNSMYVLDG